MAQQNDNIGGGVGLLIGGMVLVASVFVFWALAVAGALVGLYMFITSRWQYRIIGLIVGLVVAAYITPMLQDIARPVRPADNALRVAIKESWPYFTALTPVISYILVARILDVWSEYIGQPTWSEDAAAFKQAMRQRYSGNGKPTPAPSGAGGGMGSGEPSHDPAFDYDHSRFAEWQAASSSSREVATVGAHDDETDERLWRMAQDPRTPENERQAAMKAIQRRNKPIPRTRKR